MGGRGVDGGKGDDGGKGVMRGGEGVVFFSFNFFF